MKPEYLAAVLAVAVVSAGFIAGSRTVERGPSEAGTAHIHAYLHIVIDGEEKATDEAYIERDPKAHFHQNDSILHVHADRVDLGYALKSLGIEIEDSCLTFRVDEEDYCSGETGVRVNGEEFRVENALAMDIEQGDTIVVWQGEKPVEEYDKRLPPGYREPSPGNAV